MSKLPAPLTIEPLAEYGPREGVLRSSVLPLVLAVGAAGVALWITEQQRQPRLRRRTRARLRSAPVTTPTAADIVVAC